jgi:hypothetical protein
MIEDSKLIDFIENAIGRYDAHNDKEDLRECLKKIVEVLRSFDSKIENYDENTNLRIDGLNNRINKLHDI